MKAGTLLGFTESFGVADTSNANGKVVVEGGTFGLLNTYTDNFTKKGELQHSDSADHNVDVDLPKGATLLLTLGQDVEMGKLSVAEGAKVVASSVDAETLKAIYNGEAQKGSLKASEVADLGATMERAAGATGLDRLELSNDPLPFAKTTLSVDNAIKTISTTVERDESKTFASYASNANEESVAKALEALGAGTIFDSIVTSTSSSEVAQTMASLGDDFFLTTGNANVTHGLILSRAILDQATGIGDGRKTEMLDGHGRIWATGVGSWTTLDRSNGDADSDFYAGVIGVDADVTDNTKLGVFFGAGTTNTKAGQNKVESDDVHVGLYGMSTVADVARLSYGVMYSHLDGESIRTLQVGSQFGYTKLNTNTNVTQLFAEAAYAGFNTATYSVEPYVGFSFLHATTSDLDELVAGADVSTKMDSRNLEVLTLGVRGAVPFATWGASTISAKANLGWSHFFGDTEAEGSMSFGGTAVAQLKGEKLENLFNVGFGLEAQLGKAATAGLSYTGSYNSNVKPHGVMANIRFLF